MVVCIFIKYGIKPIWRQKADDSEFIEIFFFICEFLNFNMFSQCILIILNKRALRIWQLSFESHDTAKLEWKFPAQILRVCFQGSICYLIIHGAKFADNIYFDLSGVLSLWILNHGTFNRFVD